MEPDIFKLDSKTCCLVYNEFLVLNLPIKKIEKCMQKLQTDRRYKSYSIFRQLMQNRNLVLATFCHTIDMKKDKFTVLIEYRYIRIRKTLFVDQFANNRVNNEKESKFIQWLGPYLKKYDLQSQNKPMFARNYIIEYTSIAFIVYVVFFLCIKKINETGNLTVLIVSSIMYWFIASLLVTFAALNTAKKNRIITIYNKRSQNEL